MPQDGPAQHPRAKKSPTAKQQAWQARLDEAERLAAEALNLEEQARTDPRLRTRALSARRKADTAARRIKEAERNYERAAAELAADGGVAERMRQHRAKTAAAEGRVIVPRANLSGKTPEQRAAHKREKERLKKVAQRARAKALASTVIPITTPAITPPVEAELHRASKPEAKEGNIVHAAHRFRKAGGVNTYSVPCKVPTPEERLLALLPMDLIDAELDAVRTRHKAHQGQTLIERVRAFFDAYAARYVRAWRETIDRAEADTLAPPNLDSLIGRLSNTSRAPQAERNFVEAAKSTLIADGLGMPYDEFVDLAMEARLRSWDPSYMNASGQLRYRLPLPGQLISDWIVEKVAERWQEMHGGRSFEARVTTAA